MTIAVRFYSFMEAFKIAQKLGARAVVEKEINQLSAQRATIRQKMVKLQIKLENMPR